MSSRNVYLTPTERQAAPVLSRALQAGLTAIRQGTKDSSAIQRLMEEIVAKEPLVQAEYLSVCDPATLQPLFTVTDRAVLLGAIRIGQIRLIDNELIRLRR